MIIDSSKDRYDMLLDRGKRIFGFLTNELNEISERNIRLSPDDFRREIDFNEICIALALFEEGL